MSKRTKWLTAFVIVAGIGGLLAWYFLSDDFDEPAKKNAPVQAASQPSRISKDKDGHTVIAINPDEQVRSGISIQPLAIASFQRQIIARGTFEDDPSNAFTVRAPFPGTLQAADDRPWPSLGETLAEGKQQIGAIEPKFTPVEHIDLASRLSGALVDVGTAASALAAAQAEYDADLRLNAQDKNVSDRTVQQSRAKLDEQSAKLKGARQTVAFLESASSSTTRPASSVPLIVPGGYQVVEVTSHPGEAVDSGQSLLRLARFDTLIAAVALPAGETVDPSALSARVSVPGSEDHPLKVRNVMTASAVDVKTLGQTLLIQVDTAGLALRAGAMVTAVLTPTVKAEQGVMIPHDAVVWHEGKPWVYVMTGKGEFMRREAPTDRSTAGGFFAARGFSKGESVVVQGAQQLLSEEFKPILLPNADTDD